MKRKRIDLILSESTFKKLATFTELEKLNEAVRKYKDEIINMELRKDLKQNLLTIIEYLKRHSCSFLGVSYKGKRKIAADLGMSDRTIINACQRLELFGFIKQHPMKRSSDMQQTSNAIVIQPVKSDPKQESFRQEDEKSSDQKNKTSLKQNNILNNLRTKDAIADNLVSKIIPSWINPEFARYVSNFYSSSKEIIEFARIALINGKQYEMETREVAEIALDSFKQLIFKIKQGTKTVQNPFGLFTSIVRQKLRTAHVRGLFNDVFNVQES